MKASVRKWLIRHVPAWWHPYLRSAQLWLTRLLGRLMRALPGSSVAVGPPRNLSPTLAAYVRDRGGPGDSYLELYEPVTVRRELPTSADGGIHPAFLFERDRQLPSAGVAILEDGRVLTSTGAVIGSGDYLIADVSSNLLTTDPAVNSHLILPRLPRMTTTDQTMGVITNYRSNIYFHWLLDTLPRLHLLQKSGVSVDRIIAPQAMSYQRESAEILGLLGSALLSQEGLHLQAARVVVPSLPGLSGNPPLWACEFLRDTFLRGAVGHQMNRRIFVSRARSASRSLNNEDELVERLGNKYGVTRLFLEELTLREQVEAFHGAEVVVASHGSGLANLVFCRAGTRVIELFSPNYVNVMYWTLANQVSLVYGYVIGSNRSAPVGHRGRRVHENMDVDVGEVEEVLALLNVG